MYFVITAPDGDATIDAMDKETLLEHLHNHYYGDPNKWMSTVLPPEGDLAELGEMFVIIKGEIVTPTPKAVVKDWEIE